MTTPSVYFCPACDGPLPAQSLNLAEGVALCPACGRLTRLGELIDHERPSDEVLNQPPRGCRLINDAGDTVLRVSLRSFTGFFGSLAVCLFWNGIVSVFLVIALGGLYTNLIGPLPAWFPAPDGDEPMGLGMALFLCLFLTPFFTIGSLFFGAVVMCAAGRTEVRVSGAQGRVKTGVGRIGVWRSFDASRVRSVTEGLSKWQSNGREKELIEIQADRTIRFGTMLTDAKRQWLIAALRKLLIFSG